MMTESGQQSAQSRSYTASDKPVTAFANLVIKWRWAVIALSLLATLAAASGGQFISFSTNYRVFFSNENPQLQAFDALQNTYIREDNISIVIKPDSGDVFEPDLLVAMRKLTDDSWQIPFTTRVDSLTNFQNSYAYGEDDLIVEDLVPEDSALDAADLTRIRETALAEPLIVDRLVSPDADTASINVTVTLPMETELEVPAAMEYARDLIQKFEAENPGVTVALTGSVALNHAFTEASFADIANLIPLMYGALLVVMAVLIRSISGTFVTLMVIAFSVLTAMGLAGWAGIQLTPPSAIAPTIILTLAIADSIHVLITFFASMRKGMDKREAIVESLRVNFQPVFLTSLTTVIGFLSLNFSDAPPFRDLGNITAMGVIAAWIFSIGFLPAAMSVLPVRVKVREDKKAATMDRFADFVIGNRRLMLYSMTGIILVLAALVPRIDLNDQFVNYFDDTIEFRQDTDFAMEHLSGIYQAQWSLPAGESNGINNPEYLNTLADFTEWLREKPAVVHVQTLSDIVKRLNKNMHGDNQDYYNLPTDNDLAAQYLLLFEMSLPYGLDLNNQINVDKSSTRIVATLENLTTNELRALDRDARAWLEQRLDGGDRLDASGPFVMFAYIAQRNIEAMLFGTVLAFVLISLTLTFALRSLRLGAISLVPNLVPPIMAFGLWSVLVGEIGLASSVVTATSLGIIVDATVHFLSKYRRARAQYGEDAEGAVRYAFSNVGTALWVTTTILVAGFAILSLSAFEINSALGQLTALTLVMALIADFLLLPAILIAVDKDKKEEASIAPSPQAAE